jgi:hypothetical protein
MSFSSSSFKSAIAATNFRCPVFKMENDGRPMFDDVMNNFMADQRWLIQQWLV